MVELQSSSWMLGEESKQCQEQSEAIAGLQDRNQTLEQLSLTYKNNLEGGNAASACNLRCEAFQKECEKAVNDLLKARGRVSELQSQLASDEERFRRERNELKFLASEAASKQAAATGSE